MENNNQSTEKQTQSQKNKKSFSLTKKKTTVNVQSVQRFFPNANEGLSQKQVDERLEQGLVNKAGKKYSKSYRSIFVGNICTFFNLLCVLVALALSAAKAPLSQFSFVAIFGVNVLVSIVQEIRAKRKIDKLTILSSPMAKAVRGGKTVDIPVGGRYPRRP
jgi:cation-transporting ATPase E